MNRRKQPGNGNMLRWHAVLSVLFPLALCFFPLPQTAHAQGPNKGTDNSDVVLVIDNSGSMAKNDPNYLRLAAAKLFIDLADPGDKIGIVDLSDSAHTRSLTDRMEVVSGRKSIDTLKQLVNQLRDEPMGEETHMGDALALAYNLLDSTPGDRRAPANKRQFVVLLTDGKPTPDQQSGLVDRAIADFRSRGYWKVFAISLGAEADPAYLKRAVAEPTGAEVVVANQAADLLNSYLEVYARAGDDRFIERVTLPSNTLAPLAEVRPDHQLTQFSAILLRSDPNARISSLRAPDDADVVQPFYQNTVRRGAEPEYELYTVPLEAQVRLDGRWMANVEQQGQESATVVLLSRSRLRVRLPLPAPPGEDESGLRYHPVGRPLLLSMGAQVHESPGVGKPPVDRWVSGMAPTARVVAPDEREAVTLTDDGRSYDQVANDGQYGGLYPPFEREGDYALRLEVPRQVDGPVHIGKAYTIRVANLPTMTLTLPPGAAALPANRPFEGLIDLPGRADFTIEKVTFPVAFVRRPDGALDPLKLEPADNQRFRFQYTPAFAGPYQISIAAGVQGRGPMGAVRYVDYTEATATVPEDVPTITVSPAFSGPLTYDRAGVLSIPFTFDSRSPRQERLHVQVEGVPGAAAVPDTILINANEAGQRTITVHLPDKGRPTQGQITLLFSSPEQAVIVQGGQTAVPFRAPAGWLLPLALALAALGGAALVGYRYWQRRRARAALGPGMHRRWS